MELSSSAVESWFDDSKKLFVDVFSRLVGGFNKNSAYFQLRLSRLLESF